MRKFLPFLFAAALASSCIDNAYDLSNVNTDDVTIGDEDSEYRLPLATVYVSMSELKEGGADIKTLFDEADIWLPSPLPGNAAYVDLRELQNIPDTITPLLQALIDQMMDDDAKIAAVADLLAEKYLSTFLPLLPPDTDPANFKPVFIEAFRNMPAAGWRFEAAAVTTPQLEKARGYAQNWDEFKKAGIGLLLFGNVGTGKSYAAGCIANALIDRLESVLFVGMSDVVNRMQGNFGSDRDHYMKSLMRPDLLILDDLGAERNTSFGKERVFDVVDKRLLTGKPMIVTTNIPLSVMKQAADLDDRRIYDRILEVCVPIMFDGDSFRKSTVADNLKTAARLLG